MDPSRVRPGRRGAGRAAFGAPRRSAPPLGDVRDQVVVENHAAWCCRCRRHRRSGRGTTGRVGHQHLGDRASFSPSAMMSVRSSVRERCELVEERLDRERVDPGPQHGEQRARQPRHSGHRRGDRRAVPSTSNTITPANTQETSRDILVPQPATKGLSGEPVVEGVAAHRQVDGASPAPRGRAPPAWPAARAPTTDQGGAGSGVRPAWSGRGGATAPNDTARLAQPRWRCADEKASPRRSCAEENTSLARTVAIPPPGTHDQGMSSAPRMASRLNETPTSHQHSLLLGKVSGVTPSACHPGKASEVRTPLRHEPLLRRAQLAAERLLRRGAGAHLAVEPDQPVRAVLLCHEAAGQPRLLVRRPSPLALGSRSAVVGSR